MRNKENSYPICTLIWRPDSESILTLILLLNPTAELIGNQDHKDFGHNGIVKQEKIVCTHSRFLVLRIYMFCFLFQGTLTYRLTGQYFAASFYFAINSTTGDIYLRNNLNTDAGLSYTVSRASSL